MRMSQSSAPVSSLMPRSTDSLIDGRLLTPFWIIRGLRTSITRPGKGPGIPHFSAAPESCRQRSSIPGPRHGRLADAASPGTTAAAPRNSRRTKPRRDCDGRHAIDAPLGSAESDTSVQARFIPVSPRSRHLTAFSATFNCPSNSYWPPALVASGNSPLSRNEQSPRGQAESESSRRTVFRPSTRCPPRSRPGHAVPSPIPWARPWAGREAGGPRRRWHDSASSISATPAGKAKLPSI